MERDWRSAVIRLRDVKQCQSMAAEVMHLADQYLLVIASGGDVEVSRNQSTLLVREQGWCLIRPDDTYQLKKINRKGIVFSFQLFKEKEEGFFSKLDDQEFVRLEGRIDRPFDLHPFMTLDNHWRQVRFQDLLYRCLETEEVECSYGVQAVKEWIEQHPFERYRLADLATYSGLHPSYLSEAFKEQVGKTIQRFVTEVKVAEGKRMLQLTSLPMKEVAVRLGYEDEFYFSRKFKKETGVSPSKYRLNKQQKIIAYDMDVLGDLIALNHIPFGAPMHPKWTKSYYKSYQEDIPIHLSAYKANQDWRANLAQVIATKPDLVFAKRPLSQIEKNKLTAALPNVCEIEEGHWKNQLHQVAEAIGAVSEAKRFLADYQDKADECHRLVKKKRFIHPVIMRITSEGMSLYSNAGIQCVFEDVGIKWSADCQEVTMVQLAEMEPEMLWVLCLGDRKTSHFYEQLQHTTEWHALPAVRNDHVHMLASDTWFEYSASAQVRKLLFIESQLKSI